MFGQKYHKQLMALLPLIQQEGQQQSNHPSNKHNSNEQQSEECFTPNYNCIEEDEYKQSYMNVQNQNNEYRHNNSNFQENDQNEYNEEINERMRQYQNIDYNFFIGEKVIFGRESIDIRNSEQQQKTKSIINSPNIFSSSEIYFDNSQAFRNIENPRSNNKNGNSQKIEQKYRSKSILYSPQSNLDNKTHELIMINGKPLTNQLLITNPILRWYLIQTLFQLQEQQQNQLRQKSTLNQPINIEQFRSQIKIDKTYLEQNCFLKAIEQLEMQNHQFFKKQKEVENSISQLEGNGISKLNQISQKRNDKESLLCFKYEKNKEKVYEDFKEKVNNNQSGRITQNIQKRVQSLNIQQAKSKRLSQSNLKQDLTTLSDQIEQLSKIFDQKHKTHKQKTTKIKQNLIQKIRDVKKQLNQIQQQIKLKQQIIQERLETIQNQSNQLLDKQINQAAQIQAQINNLLNQLNSKITYM